MKWLRFIVVAMTLMGFLVIVLSEVKKEIDNHNLEHVLNYQYEKSPAKLRKIISAHLILYEKIKIMLNDLIDEVKPLLNNEDAEGIEEVAQILLEQYKDRISLAAQALDRNDLEKVNNILPDMANTVDNLYVVWETLLSLKRQLAPTPSAPKNKGLIKSAQSPRKTLRGLLFEQY